MLLGGSFRVSLIFSRTVCSFCFWAISDCVTSATFSFSLSSFSGVIRGKQLLSPATDNPDSYTCAHTFTHSTNMYGHTSLYLSVVLLHFTDVFFHKLKAKPSISKKIMTPLLWSGTKPVISLRDAGMWRTSPLLVWRWHCWRQYCENLVIVSWIPKL